MESGSLEGMNQCYEALAQVRSVRAQLKELAAKARSGRLGEAIAALDKKAAELEGVAQGSFYGMPPRGKHREDFSTRDQPFASILALPDCADSVPNPLAFGVLARRAT